MILYVQEQGTGLHLKGERLQLRKEDRLLGDVLLNEVEQLILMGNITLTNPVFSTLLDRNIDTVFMSRYGRYRGRLLGLDKRNIQLRQTQYRRYEDESFRLQWARYVVKGKLSNLRTLLLRFARRRGRDISVSAHRLRQMVNKVDKENKIDRIRGMEGAGSAVYFKGLKAFLPEALGFNGRNRRPPKDPANALLSFGYALLANSVENAVCQTGLDPHLGYYHVVDYGRPSLVLDLMEEFRPILVDSVVLNIANHGMVRESHIELRDKGVFLSDEGRKLLIDAFERRLNERVSYQVSSGGVVSLSYKQCILQQTYMLIRFIKNEIGSYSPFSVR